ncbi:nitroreductase [Xylaria bambusicola]|nr:nitroreductase [Xylaria bambusicola]KAI0517874.1 nitroreductase [Xylaria bambusicola]
MSTNTLSLLDAIKQRSSLHVLTDDVSIPDARVQEIVREAILHAPTPFNCQSGRAVVLLKDDHKKFWDIAHDAAKAAVPPAAFEKAFEPRVKMFRASYGTILFYESQEALDKVGSKVPMVKAMMPQWSEHATGMLQYAVWTMLCAEGLGVNLQHYSPMVDAPTAKQWNIPADWTLKAQMVFGKPTGGRLHEKTFEPVEDRLKVYGA